MRGSKGRLYPWLIIVIVLVWAIVATAFTVALHRENLKLKAELKSLKEELTGEIEKLEAMIESTKTEKEKLRSQVEQLRLTLESKIAKINILIDYGNGTCRWYNDTEVLSNSTLLEATMKIAKVEGEYMKFGFYVKSINGVEEKLISSNEGYSWLWYYWNGKEWVLGPTGCDSHIVINGDIYMWRYEHWKS